jgi:ribosome maturation factor RimP
LFIDIFFMDLVQEIKAVAQERLTEGQFLIDVIVTARKGPKKVMVIVDADQGFSIDDCAELSRHLSKILDEKNLIDDNYMLEVTTPGVDFPLKLNRQYKKNIGRTLKIKLREKTVEGKLILATDDSITLEQEIGSGKKKEVNSMIIPIAEIEKALVLVSFK